MLRPDDIFLPLLNAAATHVFQNGEASRNVFVAHAGKMVRAPHFSFVCASALTLHCLTRPMQLLTVDRDCFAPPSSAPNVNDWAGTLPEFRAKLLANVRAGSIDAALADFSTSDAVTSAAFTCTLMRALQNFFQFECPPLSYLECKLLLHFICQSGTIAGLCVAFQK